MSISWNKIKPDNEIDKILYTYFTSNYRKGWIEVGEDKICMPEHYATIVDEVDNFQVRDSDVYLISHPKTGTTWTQEMIWMIVNNLDFEGAKEELHIRVPCLELQSFYDFTGDEFAKYQNSFHDFYKKSVEMCKNYPHTPRLIKIHLPYSILPKQIRDGSKKPKIIYVMRNAKDTCVSYYYYSRLLEGYKGSLEDFCKLFLAGRLAWSPFWKNVMGYWERRHEPNILILKYEDMKKDLASIIIKVANFLDRELTNEQVTLLEDHLSFKKMQHNKNVNLEESCAFIGKLNNVEGKFMRSGTIGSYKADLSQEMIDIFDQWIEDNTKGTGLNFDES